jgi:hypothetical protein
MLGRIKNKHEGFIACDNEEYYIWIKKLEELFNDIGIDTSKIIVSITNNDTIWFESNRKNTAGKTVIYDTKEYFDDTNDYFDYNIKYDIFIRTDIGSDEFIRTYIHEHGHATQVFGYGNDNGNILSKFISESIACRFEEKVLKKFNTKYKMNIPIQFVNKYGKDFCFLITKREFRIS